MRQTSLFENLEEYQHCVKPIEKCDTKIKIVNTGKNISMRTMADILTQNGYKIGRNVLLRILRKDGYLKFDSCNRNIPTQKGLESEWFHVADEEIKLKNSNGVIISSVTKITLKGQIELIKRAKTGALLKT